MARLSAQGCWPNCLFLRDDFSDCEIVVQSPLSSQRFPCHRVILSVASEVFAVMLQRGFKEGETGKITVEDVTPDVMFKVLKYIYYGHVNLEDWKEATDILSASHKYGLSSLIEQCEEFLSRNLTLENACSVLELAVLYDLKLLEHQCLKLCSKGCFVILRTNGFLELSSETIKRILLMDELNIENELMIFSAVWEWAILECCRKKKQVTEETITEEISVFMDCIGFEFMTDMEINTLPKTVLRKYCLMSKKLNKTDKVKKEQQGGEADKNISSAVLNSKVLKMREVKFPLDLQDHLTKCKMTISYTTTTCITGNHTFLRFSVNCDVYLNSLTIICLNDTYHKTYLTSLHVSSKEGTLASYSQQDTNAKNNSLVFEEVGPRAISIKDSTQVQQINFAAMKLLLIKADVEYTLEVNRNNSMQNNPLNWPEVRPVDRISGNVELMVHTEKCYALSAMTVIKA